MALEPGPITPEEAKAMMQENKDLVIIDLRNPNEYVVVHFATALNIPVNELETRLSEIPEGKPILMHCIKGMRSQRGFDILKEKRPDIKELYFIKGEPIFD
jgi:rhodanese-related sulfurtransferase